jgi:DNA-binding transcriptional LysR family regulator
MIDVEALIIFAKVVEAGSFSEAGRRMGMPLSTMSRRVAELENALGVRLLERSTRRIRLTEIGAEILEHARRGIEVEEAVAAIASNRGAVARGTIRITVPPSLSESLIVPLVVAFQSEHPGVDVKVLATDRHVDLIGEGVDLAFRTGPLKDSGLVARPLLRFRHLLLASPAYLKGKKPPREPSDLLAFKLCAFTGWPDEAAWHFEKGEETRIVSFKPHLALNDYSGLGAALVAGAGIGEMPSIVSPCWRAQSGLIEVMPKWSFPIEELFMLHAGNRHATLPLRLFKDYAVTRASELVGAEGDKSR